MSQHRSTSEHQRSLELTALDLLDLADAEKLAAFFGRLGYEPQRLLQAPENLGLDAEDVRRPIRRIERLARQGDPGFQVEIYLFELSKITLKHTRDLVKAFRDRVGFFLLVLTHDWQRLDFVYVERQAPVAGASVPSLGQERAHTRPRILTVDRRNPKRVDLRVLRRLRFTAEDSFGQNEKILAAYGVVDWSEELFNNRALFSDHYLSESLPHDPVWGEDAKPVLRKLSRLVDGAAERFTGQPTAELRKGFLGPVLETLGFRFSAAGATEPPRPAAENRGFVLFAPDGSPVARCLASLCHYIQPYRISRSRKDRRSSPCFQWLTLISDESRCAHRQPISPQLPLRLLD